RGTDDGHDQVGSGTRGTPVADGPARRADGAPGGGAEPAHGAAEGAVEPEGRFEGRHEGHRRAPRRSAEGQDPEVREVGEVRALRETPRATPAAVIADGTAREGSEIPRGRRGRDRCAGPAEGRHRGARGGEGPRDSVAERTRGRPEAVRREDRADRATGRYDPGPADAGEGSRGRGCDRRTRGEEGGEGTRG